MCASYNLKNQEEFGDAITQLENCINDLRLWMHESKLKLNDEKPEFLAITSSIADTRIDVRPLQVGVHQVPPSRSAKNLGIFFEDNIATD